MARPETPLSAEKKARLRSLPSIAALLQRPSLVSLLAAHPRARVLKALRLAVSQARERLLLGQAEPFHDQDVERALQSLTQPGLRKVINATGVVLHTNLGRAPLVPEALRRVVEICQGYANLEYDLEEGERGKRDAPLCALLTELTGAEDALVVNNGAASVLLALSALASGRPVVISRGELVEIGGGFRIPDVMRQSGAQLIEVGTTNRTRLSDYGAALSSQPALLVKVHRSSFAQVGFTEEVSAAELVQLGRERGIPVFEDLGSGAMASVSLPGSPAEPSVQESVNAGVDLIAFSGDKLLGGPQAGILLGRRVLVERLRQHPLCRALRVDKMTVAALEATLERYRDGQDETLPVLRLLKQSAATLEARAFRLASLLRSRGIACEVQPMEGRVGGGAMPLAKLPSFGCVLSTPMTKELHEKLRVGMLPVIGRWSDERLSLDVRCVEEEELGPLAEAVQVALQEGTL